MTDVTIQVTVNGAATVFPATASVREMLETMQVDTSAVAVAVDGAVFPRAYWDRILQPGWQIEILTAVQGG